jgi:hypothetical protein
MGKNRLETGHQERIAGLAPGLGSVPVEGARQHDTPLTSSVSARILQPYSVPAVLPAGISAI